MKTLEEQIAGKCIHFNGIMNESCKAGVNYRETFGKVLGGVIPCLKGGTGNCDKCQYPSPEEAKEEAKRMGSGTSKVLVAYAAVKKHVNQTKSQQGSIQCPFGNHKLHFAVAPQNGHLRIACKECQISMME